MDRVDCLTVSSNFLIHIITLYVYLSQYIEIKFSGEFEIENGTGTCDFDRLTIYDGQNQKFIG